MKNNALNLKFFIAVLVVVTVLGLNLSTVEAGMCTVYFGGIPDESKSGISGVYLGEVIAGSPAEEAFLQPGDVIVKVGKAVIQSSDDLFAALRSQKPGKPIEVTYIRQGEEYRTEITLAPSW